MGKNSWSNARGVKATLVALLVVVLAGSLFQTTGAVYNGDDVADGTYQFVGRINTPSSDTCGATLISEYYALTAAHCVTSFAGMQSADGHAANTDGCALTIKDKLKNTCRISEGARDGGIVTVKWKVQKKFFRYVRFGSTQRIEGGFNVGVEDVKVNPAFAPVVVVEKDEGFLCQKFGVGCKGEVVGFGAMAADVAILKLDSPVRGFGFATLAATDSLTQPGAPTFALGWGDTDPGENSVQSDRLKITKPNALRFNEEPHCVEDSRIDFPSHQVLCVDSTNSGTGGGDSGGPLFVTASSGENVQVGITSYGPITGYGTFNYADVAANIEWIQATTGNTAKTYGTTTESSFGPNVATALIIDSSGSMSSNDPSRRRIAAAKAYLATAIPGDFASVVDFDDSVITLADATRLPDGRSTLEAALDQVNSSGGTNLGLGLSEGCKSIDMDSLPRKRAAIFLTDGDGSYNGQASCFKDRGWPVFTVGLGSGVNAQILTDIALETGGTFTPLTNASNLACTFQQVRARIAGSVVPPCSSVMIGPGQFIMSNVTVASDTSRAVFGSSWPGSDVVMTLTSPSGRTIGRDTEAFDVTHDVSPTTESYVVVDPEPGEWTVTLFGADVADEGEEVVTSFTQIQAPKVAFTMSATAAPLSGLGPLTVDLSAVLDPADETAQIIWDTGDEVLELGARASHTYREPGTYEVMVRAVDEAGSMLEQRVGSITVEGQVPTASFESVADSGTVFRLDASASVAHDGAQIIGYAWDWESDGTVDEVTEAPAVVHDFATAGARDVTLTVVDERRYGASATRSIDVVLTSPTAAAPAETTVPGAGNVGSSNAADTEVQAAVTANEPTDGRESANDKAANVGSLSRTGYEPLRLLVIGGLLVVLGSTIQIRFRRTARRRA